MKLYSFNVNGIRSAINKGLLKWVKETNPDILCLQEIKLTETELVEPFFIELGYYCHWYPAQKKGYSGVAIISRQKPRDVRFGMNIELFDNEGRVILSDFESFTLICAYFPSGTTGDIRQEIKMQFLDAFYDFANELKLTYPNLLICGDVNICHKEIDIHNPKGNAKSSGFLPEEREWVSKFLDSGFTDVFREYNNDPHNYSWWSYRAGSRAKNLGWRIDYFFATNEFKDRLIGAGVHPDVVMSDHCPVSVEIKI